MPRMSTSPHAARGRGAALALPAAIALALAGCASPFVAPPPGAEALEQRMAHEVKPVELAQAVSLAQRTHASYRAKIIELGESERAFNNGTLAFGTVILGLATANVHSSAIRGATLGTGAFYAAGLLNTDRQRSQVYLTGMGALECAVGAVQPLALNDDGSKQIAADRQRLIDGMSRLTSAMANARAQATLAAWFDGKAFAEAVKAVNDSMPAAQAAIDAASRADQQLRMRLEAPTKAALNLRTAVQGIDREVLRQVDLSRPALQSIPAQLVALKANTLFADLGALAPPVAAASAAPATNAAHGKGYAKDATKDDGKAAARSVADQALQIAAGIANALGALQGETSALQGTAQRVTASVVATAAQSADALLACKVEGVVKPLTLTAPPDPLTAGKAVTLQIFIEGGNGNLRAGFTQKPVPGLSVNVPPGTLGLVEVQATDKTVAGRYSLLVEDTTLASRVTVPIVVNAASAGGADIKAAPAQPDGAAQPAPDVAKAKSALEKRANFTLPGGAVVKIEQVVPRGKGMEVVYSTDANVKEEDVEAALRADTEMVNLLGLSPDITVRKGKAPHARSYDLPATVQGLGRADVRRLQARLCMPPAAQDGVWGPATQAALERDRAARDRSRAQPTGGLTAEERDQFLALPDAAAEARCARRAGS